MACVHFMHEVSRCVMVAVAVVLALCVAAVGCWYYLTPEYSRVGYTPLQSVSYSHRVHAGELGIDCRYCHFGVEQSPYANIPDSVLCMNCHNQVLTDDARIVALKEKIDSGDPIEWTRVHRTPDYVFFNHAVHVNRGVGCVECHGKVTQMDSVTHAMSLSMGSCLTCHRNPERSLRPLERVYDPDWQPADPAEQVVVGQGLVRELGIRKSVYCSTCHR